MLTIVTASHRGSGQVIDYIRTRWPLSTMRSPWEQSHTAFIYVHCFGAMCRPITRRLAFCHGACTLRTLPNIGREAHVFLSHILHQFREPRAHTTLTFFAQEDELVSLHPLLEASLAGRLDVHNVYFASGSTYPCAGGDECGRNFWFVDAAQTLRRCPAQVHHPSHW